jgi:hypothetical protein
MNEREMEQEGQNRKRTGWGIQGKMFFFLELLFLYLDKTVTRNPKARRANKALYGVSQELKLKLHESIYT